MAYSVFEVSEESGQPVELFEFQVGDTDEIYRYTSADQDADFLGDTYYCLPPIAREGYSLDPSQALKLTTHKSNPIAVKLQGFPDGILISLKVRRFHVTDEDTDSIVIWSGRVKSATFNGEKATLTADPKLKSLKKSFCRVSYSGGCANILYSPQCGVNKDDFKYTYHLSHAAQGTFLPVDEMSTFTDNYFAGGAIRRVSNGDWRMITSNKFSENGCHIIAPFQSLTTSENLEFYAGCDLQFATCKTKFFPDGDPDNPLGNADNYGGSPFVPIQNPTDGIK